MGLSGPDGKESLLDATRKLMRRHGLRARKGLGQHFLVDEAELGAVVAAAELSPADTVIEVGPGLGVLTRELAGRAGQVIAVELDEKLAAALTKDLASCGNVRIVNLDILKVSPEELLSADPVDYKVVANLPYYITSPALRHFLEAEQRPRLMVVMVQREVAEEIAAGPGKMSLLSLGVQVFGRAEIVARVPAASFYPPPEVDSAIVKLTPFERPVVPPEDEVEFFALARAGFSAARKQLANSLANGLGEPKAEALALLEKAGIAPDRRAETLSVAEWARLLRTQRGDG